MSVIKIALIGDDKGTFEKIKNYFSVNKDFAVVLESDDVENAIFSFESLGVDVVITQILMKGINAMGLMGFFAGKEYKPKFIVISDLKNEVFMCECMTAGASDYFLKPINLKWLEERINSICGRGQEKQTEGTVGVRFNGVNRQKLKFADDKNIDERLSTIFVSIGIPPHIKGYQFLRDGVKFVVGDPPIINSITRVLYPTIAEKHQTTPSKVERAIRHAIEVAWSRGKIENINNLFGVKVYSANEKPTNGEFIALLADKMLLEGA